MACTLVMHTYTRTHKRWLANLWKYWWFHHPGLRSPIELVLQVMTMCALSLRLFYFLVWLEKKEKILWDYCIVVKCCARDLKTEQNCLSTLIYFITTSIQSPLSRGYCTQRVSTRPTYALPPCIDVTYQLKVTSLLLRRALHCITRWCHMHLYHLLFLSKFSCSMK